MQRLSELVHQRDRCLMELERRASLPLSISPRTGHIAEFDVPAARKLLEDIAQQTACIDQALEDVNRAGVAAGRPPVDWIQIPGPKNDE